MDQFLEFAKACLEIAQGPLSSKEMWDDPSFQTLRDAVKTTGKTPWNTIASRLYTDIRDNPDTLFEKAGKGRFALKSKPQTPPTTPPATPIRSRFYEPCLNILKQAGRPMRMGEIAAAIHTNYPDLEWAGYWGVLYNVLNKACADPTSGIVLKLIDGHRYYHYVGGGTTTTQAASAEELFESANSQADKELKASLTEQIRQMNDYAFEELVNRLIVTMGFGRRYETTQKSGDGGIDGIVYGDALGLNVVYVQSKHYAPDNNISSRTINEFIGAAKGRNGVFVTSSDFTDGARKAAANTGTSSHIALINGEELVDYLIKYDIAIKIRHTYRLREVDDDYFRELNDLYA